MKKRLKKRSGWVTKSVDAALEFTTERRSEFNGFLWFAGALVALLSLVPRQPNLLGTVGQGLFNLLYGSLGFGSVIVPLGAGAWGLAGMFKRQVHSPTVKLAGWLLILTAFDTLLGLYSATAGGLWGHLVSAGLSRWVSGLGTVVVSLVLVGVALYLLEKESLVKNAVLQLYERVRISLQTWRHFRAHTSAPVVLDEPLEQVFEAPRLKKAPKEKAEKEKARKVEEEPLPLPEPATKTAFSAQDRERAAEAFLKNRQGIKVSSGGPRLNELASASAVTSASTVGAQPSTSLKNYQLPPVSLLKEGSSESLSAPADYQAVSATLEKALLSFGVNAKVVEVCPGPSVTRYEIGLAPGVKMSRVVTLADDIALAAKVGIVRIEGPIQGKGTLGVEIPNPKPQPVLMRDLIETEEFKQAGHKLVFAVGKDIGGSMVFSNLAEMPHLLVAGATGSGKSVCINAIITSILFRAAPDEVKFLMIDPKRVELTPFENIPHLIRPVITNSKEAPGALRLLVEEMETRYKLLASVGMRKIDDYNAWVAEKDAEKEGLEPIPAAELAEIPKDKPSERYLRLPYIVVMIDELADLMMVSANEVENSIARLAQMARGVGIHLVIATQRPSVDVITGTIKANFPSRIAFQVSSKIDSRTILDGSGADALLGKGDMLYNPYNVSKPVRVQGCFVSGSEVERVVAHVKKQAEPVYDPRFLQKAAQAGEGGEGGGQASQEDELYEQAVRSVVAAGQASTSVLQRRLRIGYGRAARLLDLMEQEGVIGPPDGNRPRKVLLDPSKYSPDELDVSTGANDETVD